MSSYIFFCLASDADEVNRIIEENGYGPDSLSVHLVNTEDQTQWRGTHSFVDLLVPQQRLDPLVISSYYPDGEPLANWNEAMADNNLEQPKLEQQTWP